MSWVTFIWALVIGACATMALPHLLIGLKRRLWANLFFALSALAVAGIAFAELAIMHAQTTGKIGRAHSGLMFPYSFSPSDGRFRPRLFRHRTPLAWDRQGAE